MKNSIQLSHFTSQDMDRSSMCKYKEIADRLNKAKFMTSTGREWSPETVRAINNRTV